MKEEPHAGAVQVFYFNAENKLCLNDPIFEIFNQKKFANKKVCVISIAGAFRQGKSFIQNFLIRYLNLRYKKKTRDMSHWLDPEHSPISGFAFQAGSARHTTGILMWSEFFLANLPSGEEVAIILMDTQGAFDNVTTLTDCSRIFALSTLISSVQIYNLKENIKQDDLQHLECFLGYGQVALDEESKTPFQKLLFLIRDWPFAFEKNFGFKGGKKLLTQALNIEKDKSEELIALKESIKESFRDVGCFLMPHPGKVVASSESFHGNIDEIASDFLTQVEIFASAILAPENLVLKTVNAKTITVKGLVDLMKTYWNCFKDDKLPPIKSLYLATAEIHHTAAMQEAVEEYKKQIKICKSQEEASNIMIQVLKKFRQRKKMGNSAMSKEYEKRLSQVLEELYSKNYKTEIEKIENLPQRLVNSAVSGVSMGAVVATCAILSGAAVSEIALVTILVGVASGAAAFTGVGMAIIGAIPLIVAAYKKPVVNKETEVGQTPRKRRVGRVPWRAINAALIKFVSNTTERDEGTESESEEMLN